MRPKSKKSLHAHRAKKIATAQQCRIDFIAKYNYYCRRGPQWPHVNKARTSVDSLLHDDLHDLYCPLALHPAQCPPTSSHLPHISTAGPKRVPCHEASHSKEAGSRHSPEQCNEGKGDTMEAQVTVK
jgi:hypothetical protein